MYNVSIVLFALYSNKVILKKNIYIYSLYKELPPATGYTATLVAGFRTRSNLEIVTDLTNNVLLRIRKFRL